jgi:hypothetical protein
LIEQIQGLEALSGWGIPPAHVQVVPVC